MNLRCYTFQRKGVWVSECLDLDVAAEGSTPVDSFCGLLDAASGYLNVLRDGCATNEAMPDIRRRAPLRSWVRYWFGPRNMRNVMCSDCLLGSHKFTAQEAIPLWTS